VARPGFEIHGHRGARGLHPENTIEGHLASLALVDVLETDLLVTRDGQVVLHHDVDMNPDTTRDASGQWLAARGPTVIELALADLAQYDVGRLRPGSAYAARFPEQAGRDGVRIPTLREALKQLDVASGGDARWNVEIKIDDEHPERTAPIEAAVDKVVSVLREGGAIGRVMIQSFDWRVVAQVQTVAPQIPTACLNEKTIPADVVDNVDKAGCVVWEPSFETLTSELVRQAHAKGVRVVPWTVNEIPDIERVVAMGVDGIISDYPDRVRTVVGR
jgi:glycerophosphoryl diester phosphodiesterase